MRQARILTAILVASVFTMAAAERRDENAMRCADAAMNPDPAIGACTTLIQSGHETAAALASIFLSRGTAYDEKQQYDFAIGDYSQAIRIAPDRGAEAFNARGLDYFRRGYTDLAIQDFGEAIRLNPNLAEAFS